MGRAPAPGWSHHTTYDQPGLPSTRRGQHRNSVHHLRVVGAGSPRAGGPPATSAPGHIKPIESGYYAFAFRRPPEHGASATRTSYTTSLRLLITLRPRRRGTRAGPRPAADLRIEQATASRRPRFFMHFSSHWLIARLPLGERKRSARAIGTRQGGCPRMATLGLIGSGHIA